MKKIIEKTEVEIQDNNINLQQQSSAQKAKGNKEESLSLRSINFRF
jgi:hypothetical protein